MTDHETRALTATERQVAEWLGVDPDTRAFIDAILRTRDQYDRAIQMTCAWGNCLYEWDPVERRFLGSTGPVLCGCDNLPGWRSRYPDGKPKPGVPAKARGRHGSRVQRSRHRRRDWLQLVKEFS